MMNEIMMFENEELGNVRVTILNGKEYFNLSDVGYALGYNKSVTSKGRTYNQLRKDRLSNIAQSLDIQGLPHDGKTFISIDKHIDFENTYVSEENLYDFIFESGASGARKFRKWVTSEVLPSIRKDGGYISDNATQEQVVKLIDKYSFRKITSEIHNSNAMELESKIAEMYDVNINLKRKDRDKFHHKLNKTEYKIKLKEHIRFAIENRPMPTDGVQAALEAVIRYSIIDKLDKELLTTTRKSTSAKLSYKDKENNKLKNMVEELTPPSDGKYITINYHGASNNKLYNGDETRKVRSNYYNKWISKFPNNQIAPIEYWNEVDFNKPIRLYLKFKVVSDRYDVHNMQKSIIDQLFNRGIKIDDNIVKNVVCELDGICNTFDEATIKYYIENIKQ